MSVVLTGEILVDLPPATAYPLFTPEGERAWAGDHWDPRYPDPADDTVFVTGPTTWIVLDAEPGRFVRYARVTPGDRAGLVEFAADYPAFLVSWQTAIAASLGG